MKLLLDTHVLLWGALRKKRLGPLATAAIEDPANDAFVSVVSVWEIEIKRGKGKLRIAAEIEEALVGQSLKPLPVTFEHVLAVESLPRHHRDPFDRMLIAQAQVEGLTLVTSDRQIRGYPVATMPAS